MNIYNDILKHNKRICVIGLGYVGISIAAEFAKKCSVIGFDTDKNKINNYKNGIDPTNEVGVKNLENLNIEFTYDPNDLKKAHFHIIAVPTPVNDDHTPNLTHIKKASCCLGENLQRGSIVVYESTVYPGVTEDICIKLLEKHSSMVCGDDFQVGYSPERVNPGDKEHHFSKVDKIVSGINHDVACEIAHVYSLIIESEIHIVSSIKVAETVKVAENSQRDVNIAFANELAMILHSMNINTKEVFKIMKTKWNSLDFTPGLVGGHCISVDPYYLINESIKHKCNSKIILNSRIVNEGMSKYIFQVILKCLFSCNKSLQKIKIGVLGVTYKEDCPDIRDSKAADIIKELLKFGFKVFVSDPIANNLDVEKEYGFKILNKRDMEKIDCLVIAVAHKEYKTMSIDNMDKYFIDDSKSKKIIIDIKNIFDKEKFDKEKYCYWNL